MFRLAMLVLMWWLVTGGTGEDRVSKRTSLPGTPPERQAEPEGETGAITVKVKLPKVISHIDCPPPQITRHDIEQRRRSVHN